MASLDTGSANKSKGSLWKPLLVIGCVVAAILVGVFLSYPKPATKDEHPAASWAAWVNQPLTVSVKDTNLEFEFDQSGEDYIILTFIGPEENPLHLLYGSAITNACQIQNLNSDEPLKMDATPLLSNLLESNGIDSSLINNFSGLVSGIASLTATPHEDYAEVSLPTEAIINGLALVPSNVLSDEQKTEISDFLSTFQTMDLYKANSSQQ